MAAPLLDRIRISLREGVILHNGERTRVVFRRGCISVGCTDVGINAAEFLLAKYHKIFPLAEAEVVLQDIRPDTTQFYREQRMSAAVDEVMTNLRGFDFDVAKHKRLLRDVLEKAYEAGRASCTD